MTETRPKSRPKAEIAIGTPQSHFYAQGQAVEEINSMVQAREDKTARLRQARLARELLDSKKPAPPSSKRVRKS